MNFNAGQIGIFQPEYQSRCIPLGERTGLYKDEVVSKNGTTFFTEIYINTVAKMKK